MTTSQTGHAFAAVTPVTPHVTHVGTACTTRHHRAVAGGDIDARDEVEGKRPRLVFLLLVSYFLLPTSVLPALPRLLDRFARRGIRAAHAQGRLPRRRRPGVVAVRQVQAARLVQGLRHDRWRC